MSEKSAVVQQYVEGLYKSNIDPAERSEKVLKVLSTEIGKGYADAFRQQAINGFAMIKENKDGSVTIPESVSKILELRATNTALFYATMGENVNAQASALVRLTEVMGDQDGALKVFAKANGVKQDNPMLYSEIKDNMETASNNMILSVTDLDGEQVNASVASMDYNGLKASLVETATIMEAGSRNGQGLQLATQSFKDNYTAYNKSSLLPKRIFSGIQAENPLVAGKMVIDSILGDKTIEDSFVSYNASQQAIYVNGNKVLLRDFNGIYQKLISGGATVPTGNLDIVNINTPIGQSIVEGDYEEIITRMVD